MGVNMPARTVMFSFKPGRCLKKWNGKAWRWLKAAEYAQMGGRAGRRGDADEGRVVTVFDSQVDKQRIVNIVAKCSEVEIVRSAFAFRASLREPLKASDIPDPSRQRVLRHKFFRCLWQGATCMADREHQRLLRLRFNQLQVHLWLHDLKKFIFHLGKQNFVMQTYSVACTEDASLCQHSTECKGDHLDKYIRTCRARLLCSEEASVRWFAGASSSPSGPGWC